MMLVECARFDAEETAEAAAAYLADDGVDATVVGDAAIGWALAVERSELARARVLLGLPSDDAASLPPDEFDPWDEPLPASSLWRHPTWVRVVGLLVVIGMVVPAVLGVLRWLG
jgi:hypothetical protein